MAHESIYRFAAKQAEGRRVLDAACGTGYGSHLLVLAGASRVVGVDKSAQRLRYARREFEHPRLTFERADCEALELAPRSLELVVSSNTLEHLEQPELFLDSVAPSLCAGAELIVAVPPVLSEADVATHAMNRHHATNLSVKGWYDFFESRGWQVEFFAHRCREALDFSSPFGSSVSADQFEFELSPLQSAYRRPPITAVYRLRWGV